MLTTTQIAALEALGWDFLPYAPNEWQWMKFDPHGGQRIAIQGDRTWAADLRSIRAA
jgi:hypothetical protein